MADPSLLHSLGQSSAAWEMLTTIIYVILGISSIVFIALFGRLPLFRHTPIGWTHHLLLHHIPYLLRHLDTRLTNGRLTTSATRLYNHLLHNRHPVILIIFLVLQLGSEWLFIPPALPYFPTWHKYCLIPLLIAFPLVCLWRCAATTSHHINVTSYGAALARYPYDYTLYHPHIPCRTCGPSKPARSKHCSICKTCVERQDHHCIWINNCVGLHNYASFLALLISISLLLLYGATTGARILDTILQSTFVPRHLTTGSLTSKRWSTKLGWIEWLNIWSIVIASHPRIGAVMLLCGMCWPLATGFVVYHTYLVWCGCTTNETGKWADLREDVADGIVWKGRLGEVSGEYARSVDVRVVYDADAQIRAADRDGDQFAGDVEIGRGKRPDWPKREEWWVIRTRGGAQPVRWAVGRDGREEEVVDERWVRVTSLNDVENLYDLGLIGNFKDGVLRRRQGR